MTTMHPFDMNSDEYLEWLEETEDLSVSELAGVDICGDPTYEWVPVPDFDWTRFYEDWEEDSA